MNKRERVLAAVSGEAPDRVPSGFWLHFPKGYEAGEAAVQMHLHFFEKSGTDLCKVMNENSLPNNPALSAPDDWAKLAPIPHDAPFITRQVELVRRVCEEVKGQAVVLATIHGMVASAFHYLGGGELYDNDKLAVTRCLRENPTAFRHGMEIIADYLDFLCGACIEAGADGLYFASLGGETAMMTDDEFETFFKPYEVALLQKYDQLAPCFNVLHMCKDHLNLARYLGYPAKVINWGVHEGNISLNEGRTLLGAQRVLLGGLDDRAGVLVDGSSDQIELAVHKVLDEAGTKNILLGADCTLPTDIALERIAQAVRSAGTYRR
ncbi:uroporphyrinogen decarboxylase family protein [Anaerotruncus colihominis]|uniref:uroporphyrinogen decarboxylase family protein n=1 Tax=Anaerotruncus colihominis TaxID=169435 RepID=UPI0026F36B9E|nr:uroporphyrinogen decarboxylase family protein [Anaerotruncus colihominis]